MKRYQLLDKIFLGKEQSKETFTLLQLANETDWSNEEFETISRLAKNRKQAFGSLVVVRVE